MRKEGLKVFNNFYVFYIYVAFSFLFLGAVVLIAILVHLPDTEDTIVFIVGEDRGNLIYDLFKDLYFRLIVSLSAPLILSNFFIIVICRRYKNIEKVVSRNVSRL